MTTKSQQDFDDWVREEYPHYSPNVPIIARVAWKAAEAFARMQALEEAIAICNAVCDPHNTDHGNGYNRAALDCEKKIKELLND